MPSYHLLIINVPKQRYQGNDYPSDKPFFWLISRGMYYIESNIKSDETPDTSKKKKNVICCIYVILCSVYLAVSSTDSFNKGKCFLEPEVKRFV